MSKFLDTYDIVKCSRTSNDCISIVAKHKRSGSQIQFTYNPNKDTSNNELAQMIYSDLNSSSTHSSGELENTIAQIRSNRDRLLQSTDIFMSVIDYPITDTQKTEIKAYRQQLRDITKQAGFPNNVVWPKIPDCIKDKVSQ